MAGRITQAQEEAYRDIISGKHRLDQIHRALRYEKNQKERLRLIAAAEYVSDQMIARLARLLVNEIDE